MASERTNRVVEISADSSQFVQELAATQRATEQYFDKVSASADKFAQKLDEILKKFQELGNGGGGGVAAVGGSSGGGGYFGGVGSTGKGVATGVGVGMGLAAFTSLSNAVGAIFSEGAARDKEKSRLSAMTGERVDTNRLQEIGLTQSQGAAFIRKTTAIRGVSDSDAIMRQLEAERSFGMDEGTTSGFNRYTRMGGDDSDRIMKTLIRRAMRSDLWDLKVGKNGAIEGMAGMQEALQQVAQLTEAQTSIFEKVDTDKSAGLLEAFAAIGGSFEDDPRAAGRIMSINQGITNPNNAYIDAMIKSALIQQNPNMSLPELMMKQREGVFGEGNFQSVMKIMNSSFSEDGKLFGLMQMFPNLDNDAYKRLANLGDEDLAKMGDLEGMDEVGKKLDIDFKSMAQKSTGKVEIISAQTLNIAGNIGETMINELFDYAKAFLNGVEFLLDPSKNATEKFTTALDKAAAKIYEVFGVEVAEGEPTRLGALMKMVNPFDFMTRAKGGSEWMMMNKENEERTEAMGRKGSFVGGGDLNRDGQTSTIEGLRMAAQDIKTATGMLVDWIKNKPEEGEEN